MLTVISAEQLQARLEETSREARDEFIKVVLACDDTEMTLALLDTFRITSPEAVGLLVQLVALRERGASDRDWAIWHERVKAHMRKIVSS